MRRDLGNEVIVAIAAVGILAFAITFAIILSLSSPSTEIGTATPMSSMVDEGTATSAVAIPSASTTSDTEATETNSPTATETWVVPSETATPTRVQPTSTRTPQPTDTLSPPPTNTPPDTVSAQNASSSTPIVAATKIVATPEPPLSTNTVTPHPSVTPPPTSTPPPTLTPRPTMTPRPTITPTRTPLPSATNTPSPTFTKTLSPTPTFTRTPTPTSTSTLTRTPRPTETSGIRPTPTGTLTPPSQPTIFGCVAPNGWFGYVVRQGDTLFSIAQMVGSSVTELQVANCISDINNIYVGTTILVPRQVAGSLVTTIATNIYAQGCTDSNSVISNLYPGQIVSGKFPVTGTASATDFVYYKIEVRPDNATVFNFLSRSETPVSNGQLAQIDQTVFGIGLHWIRLTVIGNTSSPTTCTIPVLFQ